MLLPKITELSLSRYANLKSLEKGESYYKTGAVLSIANRGNLIQAVVSGNEPQPYQVGVTFNRERISKVNCTCKYENDGWCKHIVAALLVCLRDPEKIEELPTLEELLNRLNLVQTQNLLQELVTQEPDLLDRIELIINRMIAPKPTVNIKQVPAVTVNIKSYIKRVEQIFKDASSSWEEEWEENPVSDELSEMIDEIEIFIDKGNIPNALALLEAFTATCAENWDELDDYGVDNEDTVEALNRLWTETILSAELSPQEKTQLRCNLEAWHSEWGADFAMSLEALRQGWDEPSLQNILLGKSKSLWSDEVPNYAKTLASIRLKLLDIQQRYQEYLYLADAEGQIEEYLVMLARLGRIEEAIEESKTKMKSMEEAMSLAIVLQEEGARTQALQIALKGLTLPGNCAYNLATWASRLAEDLGEKDAALATKIKAFQTEPSFADYKKLEQLAKQDWEVLKEDLLDYLRTYEEWRAEETKVSIFLHESLVDDAIATVTKLSSYNSPIIHQVMDVAISTHPQWVIDNATPRAEEIMDGKMSGYYSKAIEWLKKARSAYYQLERQADWSAYRAELMKTHGRKYKLMGMLREKELA